MEKTKKKFYPAKKFLAFEALLLLAPWPLTFLYDAHQLFGYKGRLHTEVKYYISGVAFYVAKQFILSSFGYKVISVLVE